MKALRKAGRPARKPASTAPRESGKYAVRDQSAHATGTTIATKADQGLRKTAST